MGKHEEYPMVGRKCINREEQFLRWINITVCLKKKGKGVGMVMCTKKKIIVCIEVNCYFFSIPSF